MNEVSFLLGLGAQKSGTTWLFRFLKDHPEAAMGEWKEYGFWDQLFLGKTARYSNYKTRLRSIQENKSKNEQASLPAARRRQQRGLALALSLMDKPEGYFPHFQQLANSRPGVRLVGDITPTYCRLEADHLLEIRRRVEEAGFALKPVFLMRDPVNRLVSAFNMELRRQGRLSRDLSNDEVRDSLQALAANPGTLFRSDYRHTVEALESAFGAGNIFLSFYETFFDRSEIARLLRFLHLSWREPPLKNRVNRSKGTTRISQELRHDLHARFRGVYDYCQEKFPEARFGSLWTPN